MSPGQRAELLAKVERDLAAIWRPEPHQVPPPGDWRHWFMLAGRGAGKTDAGAEYVDQHAKGEPCITRPGEPPHRIAIAGPDLGAARRTQVEGISGLLAHNRAIDFNTGRSELHWPNGSYGFLFGGDTPAAVERWRGPQHCLVWLDELASWRYADGAWDNMRLGLRLGADPRVVITTTPKPRPIIKRLIKDSRTAITRASTRDNPHLHPDVVKDLYDRYAGTRVGLQELEAALLDDVEGALWSRADPPPAGKGIIVWGELPKKRDPRTGKEVPDLPLSVVAVDPAVSTGEDSDETGIIGAALGGDGKGYCLADRSCKLGPGRNGWPGRAVELYRELEADCIVAEANNGGDMVKEVLKAVDPDVPVILVHAARGKRTRAEPIAGLAEQRRIIHTEVFPELEDQLCSWEPGATASRSSAGRASDSPDRLDAYVWAFTHLMLRGGSGSVTVGPDIWSS